MRIEFGKVNKLLNHYKSIAFGVNVKDRISEQEVAFIEKYIAEEVIPIMWNKDTYGLSQGDSLMAVAGPLKADLDTINTLKKKIHENIPNSL